MPRCCSSYFSLLFQREEEEEEEKEEGRNEAYFCRRVISFFLSAYPGKGRQNLETLGKLVKEFARNRGYPFF